MPAKKRSGSVKFVVVTGGVMSGLGKGIVTSSIGKLLQSRGYKVTAVKFDGYLNIDAGTMNPFRHGEVFVLDDGLECDMDLGNYERFLDIDLSYYNNPTSGKIYRLVLDKERRGEYLGVDVQMIPHVTAEVKSWVRKVASDAGAEIVLIEVGGTVGDIENLFFLEAMRELRLEVGSDIFFVHVTLVPKLDVVGEHKTKPTQHSVKKLLEIGIQPNMIIARSREALDKASREKISRFCNVSLDAVISDPDCETIYEVPLILEKSLTAETVLKNFGLTKRRPRLTPWKRFVRRLKKGGKKLTVAITGKYTALQDSYVSITEALRHCCAELGCSVELRWIETTDFDESPLDSSVFKGVDGLIVPGGFGARGAEGKIKCIEYARKKNLPFLGLCYGLQLAVVEFARNVCGLHGANSTEINASAKDKVVCVLPAQRGVLKKGGTMRLGGYDVEVIKGTRVFGLYKKLKVRERFRHRYEVNPKYVELFKNKGLVFSGMTPDKKIMQALELPNHPFFVATQFHPEFTSRPMSPSPLFLGFLKACFKK